MIAQEIPEGFVVPIHRSLIERILTAGIPRNVCMLLWTTIAAMGFGMRQIWIIPFGIVIHIVLKSAAAKDPYFFETFIQDMKNPKRLDP
jgi:type IV secretory pathway TrbD component